MKNLLKNIWDAPSSTIAGGLVAFIGVITATDIEVSKGLIVTLSAVSAFLAVFGGPNKGGPTGKLPVLAFLFLLSFALSSCSAVQRVATPDNIWRAFDIYEAGRGIYRDVIIIPEK